jgi:hypothetical protein
VKLPVVEYPNKLRQRDNAEIRVLENQGPSKGVVIREVEEIPEETPVPYKKRRGSRRSTPLVDTEFCGMEEKNVNEEVLAHKKKKVNPIAKTHNPEQAGPTGRKASSDEKE